MGTPEFSLKPLKVLIEKTNVVAVVTKPDAMVGRKKILTPSPVKRLAIEQNIPVLTPTSLKKEYASILEYKPDIIITCAYGKIVPKIILDYPKYGCINIHGSILPKYRGASPIQTAIMNGEVETGITLMYMDEGMDTGDIIDIEKCIIDSDDTTETLFNKLSDVGANVLDKNLNSLFSDNIKRIKQDDNEATYCTMIERYMEEINFNDKGINIINKIRAFNPEPLCKTFINNEEIKVIKAHFEEGKYDINKLYITKKSLGIGCIDGIIYLDIIKPIGKNNMDIKSYINGKKELLNL